MGHAVTPPAMTRCIISSDVVRAMRRRSWRTTTNITGTRPKEELGSFNHPRLDRQDSAMRPRHWRVHPCGSGFALRARPVVEVGRQLMSKHRADSHEAGADRYGADLQLICQVGGGIATKHAKGNFAEGRLLDRQTCTVNRTCEVLILGALVSDSLDCDFGSFGQWCAPAPISR